VLYKDDAIRYAYVVPGLLDGEECCAAIDLRERRKSAKRCNRLDTHTRQAMGRKQHGFWEEEA
jgi:hypothetical protein